MKTCCTAAALVVTLLLYPASISADSAVITEHVLPVGGTIGTSCGVDITYEGRIAVVNHVTMGPNGVTTVVSHDSYAGVSGFATTASGEVPYRFVGSNETVETFAEGANMFLMNTTFRLIGQGTAVDYVGHITKRIVVNANGTTTVAIEDTRIVPDCFSPSAQ
jgi:hypothetical protein